MDFAKQIKNFFIDIWNYLYVFFCHLTGDDVKDEWKVTHVQ